VLIAPDKFKGTLTASEAAACIARGWARVRPADELVLRPISDGGDGFGAVLAELRGAKRVRTVAVDAAGRRCVATWWWEACSRTAIIESARVIGLAMLPRGRFHPFQLDTRGLGMVLRAAQRRGAKQCLVGIGGSATNDGGFGLARALGWRFLDRRGDEISSWTELPKLVRIEPPAHRDWPTRLVVAVDVQNPLLGRRGCTRVYGPQKGLRPQDFPAAEEALRTLARVVRAQFGRDIASETGAGAAGGLGFGLVAFAGARRVAGFELVARESGLVAQLRRTDLVITGEGRLDRSTLMGKGVGELAAWCRRLRVPCVGLGGALDDEKLLRGKFSQVAALTRLTSPAEAEARARRWLPQLAAQVARQF
jgi:glycerate kinase